MIYYNSQHSIIIIIIENITWTWNKNLKCTGLAVR